MMGGDGDLAMSGLGRTGNPWRKVAEFSLNMNGLQGSSALKTAWEELARVCPPSLWTERLRMALHNTLTDSLEHHRQDLALTVTFVISCLSSMVYLPPAFDVSAEAPATSPIQLMADGESWGFFVIDRPGGPLHASSPPEHTIEICFYCE